MQHIVNQSESSIESLKHMLMTEYLLEPLEGAKGEFHEDGIVSVLNKAFEEVDFQYWHVVTNGVNSKRDKDKLKSANNILQKLQRIRDNLNYNCAVLQAWKELAYKRR